MPITPISPDDELSLNHGAKQDSGRPILPYPSPFFDLAQTYFPNSIKELFQYCVYFYNTNCIVPAIVNKMAAYPVTSFVYTAVEDKEVQKKWRFLFEDQLNLPQTLYEIGIDMGVYGNSFLGIYLPFKRYLKCPKCGSIHPMGLYKNLKAKIRKMEISGTCLSCNKKVIFKIKDRYIRTSKGVSIIRYDPMAMEIIADPVSGEKQYVWDLPATYKEALLEGKDMNLIEHAPMIVLEAVKEDKRVVLRKDLFYHLRRPSLAGQCSSWGYPLIMHALKSLYYLQTLKRAQEAVAVQHIVPLWVLFPQTGNGSSLPPAANIGLGRWKSNVESELKKWRQDPNYIPVFNIPIGFESIGGEGRALLLGPEIQQEVQQVIASMSVPQEFVFGGMTWTGSSITLRMLENTFEGIRDGMQRFIKFLVGVFSKFLHYAPVDIYMSELRMADDVQRQQIAMNLEATGKISSSRMLSEFGYDYVEEKRLKQEEAAGRLGDFIRDAVTQAKAQGEASLVSNDFQMQAQLKQMEAQGDMMVAQTVAQAKAQQELAEMGLMPPAGDPNAQGGDPNAQGGEQQPPEGDPNAQGGGQPSQGGDPNAQAQQGGQPQGQQVDPQTGLPIDPNTGYPVDPNTGYLWDAQSGQWLDPQSGQPVPGQQGQPQGQGQGQQQGSQPQGQQMDPQTGLPIDPNSGMPYDPNTGYLIDVAAGVAIDVPNHAFYDLQSGQPISEEEYRARQQQSTSLDPRQSAGQGYSLQAQPMSKGGSLKSAAFTMQEGEFQTPKKQEQEQRAKEGLTTGVVPPTVKALVTTMVKELLELDPASQNKVLAQMRIEIPTLENLVRRRLSEMQQIQPGVMPPMSPDHDTMFKGTTRKRM